MKFIALDIGNVLCDVDMSQFLELASENFNISLAEASRFLRRFQQIHDLGYTTMEDELKDQFGVKSEVVLKKLSQSWNDAITPNMSMIEALVNLTKNHGLQVALLSNIGVEHAIMLEEKLKWGGFFPNAVKHLSCFVGARKPSMVYYQSFLSQYPQFHGCLYVDDLQGNLDASKQFGFQTMHLSLEEPANIRLKIREIENLVIKTL
jgi:FMN phosphatase YigB (HAD superfamily)